MTVECIQYAGFHVGTALTLADNLDDNAVFLFRESVKDDSFEGQSTVREEGERLNRRGVRCRFCRNRVTSKAELHSVNGSSNHTFFNPAGIVYEIACYHQAPGCRVEGPPSAQFSWFPGHSWQYGLCRSCMTHLGWFFSKKNDSFFGLIVNKLVID